MKRCTRCGITKPAVDEFDVCRSNPDGLQRWCRDCHAERRQRNREVDPDREREYRRRWYQANKARHQATGRAAHLRRRFLMSPKEYDALLAEQAGGCAICGAISDVAKHLAVDHCHTTGAVRGILCGPCNRVLGMVGDDPARLEKAAAYLRR